MWIIINKRNILIFSDNCTHKSIKPRRRRYNSEASAKWKEVKGKPDKLMGCYWKWKPTWTKDLITYNNHPWILFSFNWGGEGGKTWKIHKKIFVPEPTTLLKKRLWHIFFQWILDLNLKSKSNLKSSFINLKRPINSRKVLQNLDRNQNIAIGSYDVIVALYSFSCLMQNLSDRGSNFLFTNRFLYESSS